MLPRHPARHDAGWCVPLALFDWLLLLVAGHACLHTHSQPAMQPRRLTNLRPDPHLLRPATLQLRGAWRRRSPCWRRG